MLLITLFKDALAPVEQATVGNSVVIASQLQLPPEKAATTVIASMPGDVSHQ